MALNNLTRTVGKGKRRLGQGHGSGRVKTSGRGTKGQHARNNVPQQFEGGALPLVKRIPYARGKGRNKSFRKIPLVVNIKNLQTFSANAVVDLNSLIKAKVVKESEAKEFGVKILGDGEITNALIIKLPISKSAIKKIEKAGGKIEN